MKGKFSEIIAGDTPTLVDFYATWCQPCQWLTPVLKEIAEELGEKVRIVKIDVDKNPELSAKFNVKGVPTLMLFKQGENKWRQSGVPPADMIKNVILQYQ